MKINELMKLMKLSSVCIMYDQGLDCEGLYKSYNERENETERDDRFMKKDIFCSDITFVKSANILYVI